MSRDGERMYFRCSLRDTCNSTCTYSSNPGHIIVKELSCHTNLQKSNNIDVQEVIGKIRVRAGSHPYERPAQIVAEELQGIQNEELMVMLPQRQTLLRTINRHQNEVRAIRPRTLEDCVIIHPYD